MSRLRCLPLPLVTPRPLRHRFSRRGRPGTRVEGYSFDELLEKMTEEQRKALSIDLEVDLEERMREREQQRANSRAVDYADRQQLWPTSSDWDGNVRVDPDEIGPDPTLGPIGKQISTTYREAMITGEINEDHKRYWFTEPPGGWDLQPKIVKEQEVMPGFFASAKNNAPGQRQIEELKVGDRFTGTVTEIWYHHGIKVDIGFDYDGLLPMYKETWDGMKEMIECGTEVNVEVEKIWNKEFYRWPIQLRSLDPEIQPLIIPPAEWDPPIDARGKTIEEIEQNTNRRMPTAPRYFFPDQTQYEDPYAEPEEEELGEDSIIGPDGREISIDDYCDMMDEVWANDGLIF